MNRTDRLYAIVEELRAVSPRPRSATWLAERFEVSTRTVERDISALQQAGNPIWADVGRNGGYCIDREHTLPPVNFTADEAVALAVAVEGMGHGPFRSAAQVALRKVVAAMHEDDAHTARALSARVHLLGSEITSEITSENTPGLISSALSSNRVLRIGYRDRDGEISRRDIEPLGYIENAGRWYLVAWCRLRTAVRAFRTDRIESVVQTAEAVQPRDLRVDELQIPYGELRSLDSI